ncbi:Beta-lactamase enzyme family protein [Flagellimonas flava]|uniref:Beta-lactamase enzyme family protein n=2 Tax=Flagellimonas flava TaxID=570519 RepID=A0A1M5PMM6_9FLAO|nr:Beta-lactamase enzyme family protein [Allomuricauda flava]
MMPRKSVLFILFAVLFLFSCTETSKNENPLQMVLRSENPKIKRVVDNLEAHEVQIRYTQINRENDSIVFTDFDFQVDPNRYFYPASTVKFPAVVAALEKVSEIDSLTSRTIFYIEGDSVETTIAKAVSEIFAVSDNAANNRLLEFLGQDDLNQRMAHKGVAPIRIAHRLSTPNADDATTRPLVIYINDSTTSVSKSIINTYPSPLDILGVEKGTGFYTDDSLHREPFDFSLKNYYPIQAQHGLLKRVIFPEAFAMEERFQITDEQRHLLLAAMHTLPKEVGYDSNTYYDSYVKFLVFGDSTDPIPEHIKIYNKVGYAYGTLTDCAYIKDTQNDIDFMVTATILVNKDGIFNDNFYEYDEIGIPFLAELGRELYAYELKRKR